MLQHYPRTKKYISLFPPERRQIDSVSTISDDNNQRTTVRALIQDQMRRGEISKQPENELEGGSRPLMYTPDHSRRSEEGSRRKDDQTSLAAHRTTEGDDFFGEDGETEASGTSEMEVE
jgi:hypothetical protein